MMTATIKRGLICAFVLLAAMLALAAAIAEGEAYMAKVTVSKMYIRAEADSKSEVLGYLAKGKQFTVIEVNDGIAYIEYNGRKGYAKASDMTKVSDAIGTAAVNVDSFKVYAAPSADSMVIATVKKGASFVLVAKTATWAKLQNGTNIGYAPLEGLTISLYADATPTVSPTPAATPASDTSWAVTSASPETAEVKVDAMTVRSGPTAAYDVLGTLDKGTQFSVHTTKDGIAYIEYKGKFGFCRVSDYNIVKPEYRTATVTAKTLKVYASATTSSKVLATVKKGATFTVLDYNSTWVKLQNGSNIGYAKLSGLSLSTTGATPTPVPSATVTASATATASAKVTPTPTPTPKPTATPTPTPSTIAQSTSLPALANKDAKVYKYATSKSDAAYSVKTGAKLTVLGYNDSWALISTTSGKGYIALTAVTKVSDVTISGSGNTAATVKTDNLKFYEYATTISTYMGSLKKGTAVTILAYNDTWAHVSYNGKKGYCKLNGLNLTQMPTIAQTESKAAVLTQSAKLYKYAINTSDSLGTMSANSTVTILGHNDVWALVQYGSKTGYVQKVYVTPVADVTITENQSYYANVLKSGTVYKYTYATSPSAGSVSKGALVTVLGQKNGWALIQKGSNKGYIQTSYLEIIYDEFVSPSSANYSATVVSATYLYKMALTTSDKLTSIGLGNDLTVTSETSKWAKVTYGSQTGYVLKSALSTASYTELKSGTSSGSSVTNLQKKLEELGYFDGIPAGNYGSLTVNAVKRFQTELGIEATGTATVATLRVLYSGNAPESPIKSANLSKGSTGTNVTRLQTRLTYKGYMNGSLDGDYGNVTANAVKSYQKAAGLTQTGEADSATLRSLFSSSAPTNTASTTTTTATTGTAGTGKWSTDPDDDPAPGTANEKIETVIEYALAQLGKPYIYGTSGTKSYDCSGLTCYCYKKVGVSLGRSAYAQGYNNVGTKIEGVSNLKRGDLVCLNTLTDNDLSDHVGIYLGGGKFIHASSSAGKVIISSINSGYYYRVFSWGRRLL